MNLRIKKIDWYIIKKFMMTFFIALLLIIGIVIIFDISDSGNHILVDCDIRRIDFLSHHVDQHASANDFVGRNLRTSRSNPFLELFNGSSHRKSSFHYVMDLRRVIELGAFINNN